MAQTHITDLAAALARIAELEAALETESQAMVAAVLEAAAKRCEDDIPNWAKSCGQRGPGNDFADMIRALITTDQRAALDRQIAEAAARGLDKGKDPREARSGAALGGGQPLG